MLRSSRRDRRSPCVRSRCVSAARVDGLLAASGDRVRADRRGAIADAPSWCKRCRGRDFAGDRRDGTAVISTTFSTVSVESVPEQTTRATVTDLIDCHADIQHSQSSHRQAPRSPARTDGSSSPTIRSSRSSKATAPGPTSGGPACACSMRRWRRRSAAPEADSLVRGAGGREGQGAARRVAAERHARGGARPTRSRSRGR